MIFIFFGPPGSGKGTQAQYLVDNYGFIHISTGELLRREIEEKSELGGKVQSLIESGLYVPDEVVTEVVSKVLSKSTEGNFIFDGYPRTLNQALAFDELLSVKKLKVDLVVNFVIETEKLVERISGRFSCASCGAVYHDVYKPTLVDGTCDKCQGKDFVRRKDDNPEVLKKRVEIYMKEIEAVCDFYRTRNLVKDIDASQTAESIKMAVENSLVQSGFII